MAKILVTGAAGFIGAHVAAALLKRGDEVVCLDNFNDYYDPALKEARVAALFGDYKPTWYRIDISNSEDLQKVFLENKFDIVCHLAAQAGVRYSLENPDSYIKSNIIGTHNILEAVKKHKISKLIFASSSSVYSGNEKLPWSETDPVDKPISIYAATKKANEVEAYAYHHLYGISVVGLRFFTVYGPWGRPDMAYFKFAQAIANGKPIEVYNNGKMKRDFTYIDDIVDGVLKAIGTCKGYEVINLGNHAPVELERFISIIESEVGSKAQKNYLPMQQGDFLENFADIEKANALLGWQPVTNIETGLKKFIVWFKEYHHVK